MLLTNFYKVKQLNFKFLFDSKFTSRFSEEIVSKNDGDSENFVLEGGERFKIEIYLPILDKLSKYGHFKTSVSL